MRGGEKGKLLVDECLSPDLVLVAKMRGYDATHITYIGKAGWQDYNLVNLIVDGGYIFVTNNGRDFRKLLGEQPIHNGLVILVPRLKACEQERFLEAALDFIEHLGHTINRVVEVHAVDDIRLSNLPPED
jgi:predicted nuclease of predicted toxin-antitoxin system